MPLLRLKKGDVVPSSVLTHRPLEGSVHAPGCGNLVSTTCRPVRSLQQKTAALGLSTGALTLFTDGDPLRLTAESAQSRGNNFAKAGLAWNAFVADADV